MEHRNPAPPTADDDGPADGDVTAAALTVTPRAGATGEKRLMRAVLLDAVQVYLERFGIDDVIARRELAEVQRWFRSDDRTWPFAFENVCEALDLDPERVRRGLRAVRDARRPGRGEGAASAAGAPPLPPAPAPGGPVDIATEPLLMSRTAC